MPGQQRDIILLLKDNNISSVLLEQQVQCLHRVIGDVEKEETFCRVLELVNRNRITSKRSKILHAIAQSELKPFRFLICKN